MSERASERGREGERFRFWGTQPRVGRGLAGHNPPQRLQHMAEHRRLGVPVPATTRQAVRVGRAHGAERRRSANRTRGCFQPLTGPSGRRIRPPPAGAEHGPKTSAQRGRGRRGRGQGRRGGRAAASLPPARAAAERRATQTCARSGGHRLVPNVPRWARSPRPAWSHARVLGGGNHRVPRRGRGAPCARSLSFSPPPPPPRGLTVISTSSSARASAA